MITNVLYDKCTKAVIAAEMDGLWVIPNHCELATFNDGVEPVLVEANGYLYLKQNALIVAPDYLD